MNGGGCLDVGFVLSCGYDGGDVPLGALVADLSLCVFVCSRVRGI